MDNFRPMRRFTDLIGLLARGRFVEKCDEHLAKTIEALSALPDRKGTATISISLIVTFLDGRVDVTPRITSKLPEEKGFNATPFWALDGGLSVQHPSQADMFPRDTAERTRDRDIG